MKQKKPLIWYPFYVDKWLFGSTRLELEPDERGVWVDLLTLSQKDEGHIRANEGMPYPDAQLAGMLVVSVELLQRTIEKCIKYNKLKRLDDDTLYVINWEQYKLTPRHMRRFDIPEEEMSEKPDIESAKGDEVDEVEDTKGKESKEKVKKKITKAELTELRKKIIHYFNETTGQNRKLNVKETNDFINGRLNDGRTFEDFVHVIDTKTFQWQGDPKMQRFLRPSTLFRPGNFEDYLNEPYVAPKGKKKESPKDRFARMAKMPDVEWDAVAKYLYANKKEEKDVARFLAMTNKHYGKVRDEWEASEKKPEEFVRLILAAEMEAKTPKDEEVVDYEKIPELELEKIPPKKEEPQDVPDKGTGRRRTAGDSGYQQRHLDLFFDKFWEEHSENRDKDSTRESYMKLVRSGQYKPQDLFEKPDLVQGKKTND